MNDRSIIKGEDEVVKRQACAASAGARVLIRMLELICPQVHPLIKGLDPFAASGAGSVATDLNVNWVAVQQVLLRPDGQGNDCLQIA